MLNDEQIAAYREMAKNAGENSMEAEEMKPTAEAQTVLDKWLKDFGKDAVKAMKKVA